nr:protein ALP1-like [Tanacetum cinerariifolium]
MAKLAFCEYHNMVAILEKTEHNTDFHQIVDFLEASHIRYALTVRHTVYVSHIRQFCSTARVETMDGETKILAKVNGRTIELFASMLVPLGKGLEHPSEPHHTPSDQDETAFAIGDAIYGEAFPTVPSLDAGQDRKNISKTSIMPHEASPMVTSLAGDEGSIQQKLQELMDICTSLQRQHLLMEERVQSQDLEISQLKTKVKTLEDNKKRKEGFSQEDAPNTGASGGLRSVFTTASLSVTTTSTVVSPAVATASGSFSTATIFTIASVATPTTRVTRSSRGVIIESSSPISVNIPSICKKDKRKGKMTEPEQPSKENVLEQMSAQLARDLETKFAQEDQIIRKQAETDFEIARIHAERELEMMIAELDRINKIVAKYLSDYEQAEVGLSHDEKVELIDELLMYQRNLAQIKKYQAQQNKPATKTERRDFYMSILRSNASWKAKDFKGMTFEQIEEKFIPVWEKMQYFVPMNSKLESERLKRPGIQLGKESFKKLKTTEASGTEPTLEQQSEEPKELSEEDLKKIIELVPVKELYIEALQVKYPIIDWEIYSEDQRKSEFYDSTSNNDINVTQRSPLLNDLKLGKAPEVSFVANGVSYPWGYYLCDEIYQEWVPFVKSVTNLADDDYKRLQYKTMHEAARKYVERAFGVLKKKWAILASPARTYIKEKLANIMYTCIILHNMIIKDRKKAISLKWYPEKEHQPDDLLRSNEQRYRVIRSEFGVRSDSEYETD